MRLPHIFEDPNLEDNARVKFTFTSPELNQNIEIFNKNQINRFKTKKHNNLYYKSSYELDFIMICEEKNILIENGPTIKYSMFGKNKIYFPDFYIPKLNLIVEIKSSYFYNLEKI